MADRGWGRTVAVVLAAMPLCAGVAYGAIGDLDTSFAGGVVVSQLGQGASPGSEPLDVAVQPDGRIVAGGAATDSLGHAALALARYLPSGAFDTSFGGGTGTVVMQFGGGASPMSAVYFNGLVPLADGRLITCGAASDASGHTSVLVARFTAGGLLDSSFGSGGRVLLQLGTAATPSSNLFGCSIQPADGKIIGVGVRNDIGGPGSVVVVLRLTPDGNLDATFGSGGVFSQQLGVGATPGSTGVDSVVLSDGRIAISLAASDTMGHGSMGIARLTTNGTLDPTFGTGGVTITTFLGASPSAEGIQIGLQPSGKFVVSGDGTDSMGNGAFGMTRYSSTGAPDPTFGTGGLVASQLGSAASPSSFPYGQAMQPNGKIVLVGFANTTTGATPLTLARYNSDGGFDATFGSTGIVQKQFATGASPTTAGTAGVFTPAGKLVVTGITQSGSVISWFVASFIADLPPTAAFTFSPSAPVVGDTITFDGSGSHDGEGPITQIAWDLNGDGTFGDATGTTATSSFTTAGLHHVSVLVTDDDGLQAAASADVPVGCGTAQSFLSVECRLAALLAQVDGGVTGSAHDRLHSALANVQMLVQEAAGQTGKAKKKTLAKALRGLGKFMAGVRKGKKSMPKAMHDQLLGTAGDLRTALKALRAG